MTYASNSTMATTYLRLQDLESALDAMWGLVLNEEGEDWTQEEESVEGDSTSDEMAAEDQADIVQESKEE